MENISKKYGFDPACPVRNVLDRFGDKWSILIIIILGEVGKMRFNQLHKTIGDVSQKMLTTTLRTLEADGLVSRKVFPEIPPRVECKITGYGQSLMPLIGVIQNRGLEDLKKVSKKKIRQPLTIYFLSNPPLACALRKAIFRFALQSCHDT